MDDALCRGSRTYASEKPPVSCQTRLSVNYETTDLFMRLRYQDEKVLAEMPAHLRRELADTASQRFRATLNLDMLKAIRELTMSFIYHGFILVFAGGIAVVVALYRFGRARLTRLAPEEVRLPRLIINNAVLAALTVFGVINVALCFAWLENVDLVRPVLQELGLIGTVQQIHVPAEVVQMAMMTTTALIVACQIPAIMNPLGGVLQIMQGLIDHHYRMRVSLMPRLWAGETDKPMRRDHITGRMGEIVDQLVAKGGFNEVVLLSHSQGSVIVYDYLASGAPGLPGRAHVLTAGSPLGALYGYYFN
jgi:hypothetical protein